MAAVGRAAVERASAAGAERVQRARAAGTAARGEAAAEWTGGVVAGENSRPEEQGAEEAEEARAALAAEAASRLCAGRWSGANGTSPTPPTASCQRLCPQRAPSHRSSHARCRTCA